MTREVIKEVITVLEKGEHAVLVTLCSTDGSTPRKAGAKMLVYPDSSIVGTIGGGSLEYQAIKKAQEVFARGESLYWQCDLEDLGMVCGGHGTVLIEYI
ncbi:MAG: XdhC family protein [Bacillota bacterium]|jgi:xanthine/CO dehydrogenase XdhC/CoxF family maturation factor